MRDWIKNQWLRFKNWAYGLLAAIGLVAVPMLASALVTFSWTNPTLNEDGSVLDPSQLVETRLYCDIDPAAFTPEDGSEGTASSHTADAVYAAPATTGDIDLSYGRHDCFATAVADYDGIRMESMPSGVATKIVKPPRPNPPGLD